VDLDDVEIAGFAAGILAPDAGTTRVGRGTFRTLRAIEVDLTDDPTRIVRIEARPRTKPFRGGRPEYAVYLARWRPTGDPADNPLGQVLLQGRPLSRSVRVRGAPSRTPGRPPVEHFF
jgi:hypothetical protein